MGHPQAPLEKVPELMVASGFGTGFVSPLNASVIVVKFVDPLEAKV